jgi:cyclic-di-GMP phosphodiesterase TipF (flagellum assembly factor)
VAALEAAPTADLRALTEPLIQEIDELTQRVNELAEAAQAARTKPIAPTGQRSAGPGPFAGRSEEEVNRLVRDAIDSGRVEMYLQPIVTLPQRKVRFYEALARLKLADGTLVEPEYFLQPAQALSLLPRIDLRMLRSCVQVVRRLAAKNREVGLFVNVAPETLADGTAFGEILGLLEANRALAPSIMIEIAQSAFRTFGPIEQERLSALFERGFRFALDRAEDLRLDPRALTERGVRVVKVPVEIMLQRSRGPSTHIHPADLADLLGRHGVELVVTRIESEGTVVDLLDHDVRYGQGFLFAPPRPVRAEALREEPTGPRDDDVAPVRTLAAAPVAPALHEARDKPGSLV